MKIEKSELLRYLGHRGQEYSPSLDREIDIAIDRCLSLITPRCVIKKYGLDFSPLRLKGTDVVFEGEDIARHLSGCDEVYLMGATVGFEVEKEASRLMRDDPLAAVLLDSASICAIESYCDDLCELLQAQSGDELTSRFSCGYGDFPLSAQRDFARLLELPKKIGVFMNEDSFMLSPQKSVTAAIGIGKRGGSPSVCTNKCYACNNASCAYRREE